MYNLLNEKLINVILNYQTSILLVVLSIIITIISVTRPQNQKINETILGISTIIIMYSIIEKVSNISKMSNVELNTNNLSIIGISILEIIIIIFGISIIWMITKDKKSVNESTADMLVLLITNLAGLLIIIQAQDFVTLYLGIELQTLGAFVLASWRTKSELSVEAGLKYYVLGSMASGILLFGISLIYWSNGSVEFNVINNLSLMILDSNTSVINENVTNSTYYIMSKIGILMVIIAILFKIGGAPFHSWLPDVYQGSPTIITAYFSTVPKIAIITALINIISTNIFIFDNKLKMVIVIGSIISMLIGSISAINQYNLKRLLAYSSIGHTGYLLIGIVTGTNDAYINVLVYMIIYMITNVIIWNIILSSNATPVVSSFNKLTNKSNEELIDNKEYHLATQFDLRGYGYNQPIRAIILSIALLSLAGIPPLAGFYGKWYLFLSAINGEYYILAIFGVVTSVISAVYYIRLIHLMFFVTPDIKNVYGYLENLLAIPVKYKQISLFNSLILSTFTLLLLVLMFDFDLIIKLCNIILM